MCRCQLQRPRNSVTPPTHRHTQTTTAAHTFLIIMRELGEWLRYAARNVTGACTGSTPKKAMLPPQCHSAASKDHGRWGAAPHGFHVSERYGDLVTGCFGETLLTTRAELGSLYPVWRNGVPDSRWSGCLVTLVRWLNLEGSGSSTRGCCFRSRCTCRTMPRRSASTERCMRSGASTAK